MGLTEGLSSVVALTSESQRTHGVLVRWRDALEDVFGICSAWLVFLIGAFWRFKWGEFKCEWGVFVFVCFCPGSLTFSKWYEYAGDSLGEVR